MSARKLSETLNKIVFCLHSVNKDNIRIRFLFSMSTAINLLIIIDGKLFID